MLIPGSSGPIVTLHTPPSPSLLIAALAPTAIQSPETLTSVAFGAYTRNVTRRSEWTSGEMSASAAGGAATTTIGARQLSNTTVLNDLMKISLAHATRPESQARRLCYETGMFSHLSQTSPSPPPY